MGKLAEDDRITAESLLGQTMTVRLDYRETHFNFVSRLAEQEDIYYYFNHEGLLAITRNRSLRFATTRANMSPLARVTVMPAFASSDITMKGSKILQN
jgi:uncharacterized protein involved in type VI secretion and phage assembly